MKKPLQPGSRHQQGINFFVCTCAACGEKQEIFATELHKPHHCRACGGRLDFKQCSFEPPTVPPPSIKDKPIRS